MNNSGQVTIEENTVRLSGREFHRLSMPNYVCHDIKEALWLFLLVANAVEFHIK